MQQIKTTLKDKFEYIVDKSNNINNKKEVYGFTQINNSFLIRNDLNVHEKMVGIILKKHAMNKTECWPSIKKMAKEVNCSETTVKKAIKKIESKFLIRKRRHPHHRSNFYDVLF
ncbi:MAG TPA: helix-turn-helix domain-containing protein [Candidatus Pacearchaeota archaeon]|nr:helix-turn-helix domain-containing protein [Candidatus Pacearchaeota archaeon]